MSPAPATTTRLYSFSYTYNTFTARGIFSTSTSLSRSPPSCFHGAVEIRRTLPFCHLLVAAKTWTNTIQHNWCSVINIFTVQMNFSNVHTTIVSNAIKTYFSNNCQNSIAAPCLIVAISGSLSSLCLHDLRHRLCSYAIWDPQLKIRKKQNLDERPYTQGTTEKCLLHKKMRVMRF